MTIMRASFEHAYQDALAENVNAGWSTPTPTAIQLAAHLRRRGWTGTARDAARLAEQLGAKLADDVPHA